MLDIASTMPYSPEQITAAWLQSALTVSLGVQVSISTVEIDEIIWGTATKVLIRIAGDCASKAVDLPGSLCIKGGFDPAMDASRSPIALTMEADFYGTILTRLNLSTPRAFYAGVSCTGDQGIIVLEDLRGSGAVFCEPGAVLSVDEVAAGLEELAMLHGATWNVSEDHFAGVRAKSVTRGAVYRFLSEDYWEAHFSSDGAPSLPAHMQDPQLLLQTYRQLWAADAAAVPTLQHGDAHVGNVVQRAKQISFIDWQSYYRGPWAGDVSYFLSGALTVEDRRRNERDLLDHYLQTLSRHGGPQLSREQAWPAYVQHLFNGIIWALAPEVMQPFERSRAMCERHVAAIDDHDVLAAVRDA